VSSFLGRIAGAILGPISEARRRSGLSPRLGAVDWGDLRRTSPVSDVFGFDRGTPIDRYYIEAFLQANASAIRGRVLEIGDRTYTERFGGDAVTVSDVLHVTGDSPDATIVADLTHAPEIADGTFDCVIITQTLQFTYDMEATVAELHRILAPGGVVLCTVPGISQISRYDMDRWGDYWRLTSLSARTLFETAFPVGLVEVRTYGNVLSAVAFLHGLATSELTAEELDTHDDDYQVIVALAAAKPGA
jgi:SAM-dependent methyltransferase